VQAFGKIQCSPAELGVDALTAAAHKFYGPHGAGFLWLRPGLAIEAIQHGGYHENERRPGTENAAAIAGMAAAAERAVTEVSGGAESARQSALREKLWEGILNLFRARYAMPPELRSSPTPSTSAFLVATARPC